MHVLHVPFSYFPSPHGGTEVYVAALADALISHRVNSSIAAPGERDERYAWKGVDVYRFKTSSNAGLLSIYGEGDAASANEFGRILDEVRPDIVHFHALTPGASILAMREAKRRGIPLIFTYHTPTVSCVRGTMMKWGSIPCNGLMNAGICSACTLHGKRLPRSASLIAAGLHAESMAWLGRTLGGGRLATALQLPSLVRKRHAATRAAFGLADKIVAVCDWVRGTLLNNGVPEDKVALCRQGLPGRLSAFSNAGPAVSRPDAPRSPVHSLRLAYFGRLDPTKGIPVVIDALRRNPELPVMLDVYGVAQGESGENYRKQLLAQVDGDGRIQIQEALESTAVPDRMRDYDLIVIPSLWLETGPLIVYEAFAAGVPVLGSNLGGIAELVTDAETGRLLPAGDASVWADELARLAARPEAIANWRAQLPKARTMADVAVDMMVQYRALLLHKQKH